jgi:hypothetical protein
MKIATEVASLLTPIQAIRAKARELLKAMRIPASRIGEVWKLLQPYCQVRIPNGSRAELFPDRLPPLKAIRQSCVHDCCAGSYKAVEQCQSFNCPLHSYRFGKNQAMAREGANPPAVPASKKHRGQNGQYKVDLTVNGTLYRPAQPTAASVGQQDRQLEEIHV